MPKYSVAVALFDYLPILASAVALGCLARLLATSTSALYKVFLVGAASVIAGGLCKASWKLLTALSITPPPGLDTLLFLLMPAGFVMIAVALHQYRHSLHQFRTPMVISSSYAIAWLPALLLVVMLPESRMWFVWLLALSVIANAGMLWQCAGIARAQAGGAALSIGLLVYSFCAAMGMAGLSRLPEGELTAWAQELTNLSGQMALAIACWRIQQKGQLS